MKIKSLVKILLILTILCFFSMGIFASNEVVQNVSEGKAESVLSSSDNSDSVIKADLEKSELERIRKTQISGTTYEFEKGISNLLGGWNWLWFLSPISAIVALYFAWRFYHEMKREDEGSELMKSIAGHVKVGARAYLKQQYKVVLIIFGFATVFLFILAKYDLQSKFVPYAFLTGGLFSGLAGFFGMKAATEASARTAQACKQSLNHGLQVAFRSGAVMGLVVVGLGLIDICLWFIILIAVFKLHTLAEITVIMLCFGMGASLQALFARVGGGIFTKAADVGADLVGKVVAGIPEDDPRNPAVIADNVGDNVGDVAGLGADLYESYCGSILATTALAAAAGLGMEGVLLPMILSGIGVFASIFGIYLVKADEKASLNDLLRVLGIGVNSAAGIIAVFAAILVLVMVPAHKGIMVSIWLGIISGILIGHITEYYTSFDNKPVKGIAEQAKSGHATVIIDGFSVGMISTTWPVIIIAVTIIGAFGCAGGFEAFPKYINLGLYGIGMASVGMLSTLGITLATDAYGPIADNAGGNAEMSKQEPFVRERTDKLDSLGNTTAATGKGFAVGSAALTGLAFLAAYIEEVRIALERMPDIAQKTLGVAGDTLIAVKNTVHTATLTDFVQWYHLDIMNPKLIAGIFVGAMLSFLFSGLTTRAVGNSAATIIDEVKRQFDEIPGLLEGKEGVEADYSSCVKICTQSAQKEMIMPAMLALVAPIIVGLLLGVPGVVGMLTGGLSSGFLLALFMANAGGAWDNAKKYIESEWLLDHNGVSFKKGSEPHKAAVVGDTVGDPFKDTAGPSLDILIKLMSMVSIVFAGLIVKYSDIIGNWFFRMVQ